MFPKPMLFILALSIPACAVDDTTISAAAETVAEGSPTPPPPPASGPGSSAEDCCGVVQRTYGSGAELYYLFEPASPAPVGKAPVIVFVHGWQALEPFPYRPWITHLVRRGNIVIYPRYQ